MTFYCFDKKRTRRQRVYLCTYFINSEPVISDFTIRATKEKFSLKHIETRLQYIETNKWGQKIYLEVKKQSHD